MSVLQCSEFESRLQALLDARQSPGQDMLLELHAQQCERCWRLRESTAAMLLAVAQLPPLRPSRALVAVEGYPRRHRLSPRAAGYRLAAAGLAAALLFALIMVHPSAPRAQWKQPVPPTRKLASLHSTRPAATDVLRDAGRSWWAVLCDSAQPLTDASAWLSRPNLDMLSDALAYREPSPSSWNAFSNRMEPFTRAAGDTFHFLGRIAAGPTADRPRGNPAS